MAVKNVEEYVNAPDRKDLKLPTRAETPMKTSYQPELDVMPELDAKASAYYQSLIGILQWVVELGHVDICLEVSMMSTHMALPRMGHLDQVLQIFGYLKKYHNTELVYDPSEPEIELPQFERRDWMASEFGLVVGKEETPNDMPEPRGMGLSYGRKLMWTMRLTQQPGDLGQASWCISTALPYFGGQRSRPALNHPLLDLNSSR